MIIGSGIQIGTGITIAPSAPVGDIYTYLTSEDGVTQLLTEDGDFLVIE